MTSKDALSDLIAMATLTLNKDAAQRLAVIKKDLDRLEKLEKENQELKENSKKICECDVDKLNKIKKDLEALEIIKEQGFLFVEKGQLYCGRYGDIEVLLEEDDFQDKQEYELLKEVIENE